MKGFLSKLFCYECWTVAWRRTDTSAYPSDPGPVRYQILRTDRNHWTADPFLIEDRGHTYLFFEYMPFHSNRASIACCELSESGAGPERVVLNTDGHLSYPAVFRFGSDYYMIPESLDTGKVSLYRADPFPDRWVKVSDLLKDFNAVDSTPVVRDGSVSLFLYDPDEPDHRLQKLYSARLSLPEGTLQDLRLLKEYPEKTGRPAGNVMLSSNRGDVRPTQDCRKLYGGSVRYLAFSDESGSYSEAETSTLSPSSIRSDLPYPVLGIHTVNRCGSFEAVDLFYRQFSLLKPFRAIARRLSK